MTFNETDTNRDTVGRFSDKIGSAPDVSLATGVSEARAAAIFEDLMEDHGLIKEGWRFNFDRATSRVGYCDYSKKSIQLSRPLLRALTVEQVRQTALHEIAHAKTPGAGHGRRWAAHARAIGYVGKRCAEQTEAVRQVQEEKRARSTKDVAHAPDGTPVYKGDTFGHGAETYTVTELRRTNAVIRDRQGGDSLANLGVIGKILREKDGRDADPSKVLSRTYPAERLTLSVGDKLDHRGRGVMVVDDLSPKTVTLRADNGQLYAYSPRSASNMSRVYS